MALEPFDDCDIGKLLNNHEHHGIQRPADALMNNRCGVDFVKIEEPVQIGPVFTRRRKLEILAAETITNSIDQVQAGGAADDILRKGNGCEFGQADIEILFDDYISAPRSLFP